MKMDTVGDSFYNLAVHNCLPLQLSSIITFNISAKSQTDLNYVLTLEGLFGLFFSSNLLSTQPSELKLTHH
jgi:hypothetical protein